ncbi:serine hydrolase domain-containing protein [Hyalangium gracile]|uniref:serine hydrolase domain-containing protein n=1 Tax=Hyalangium gracile TaxID=394092 RepID=UPI001CCA222F|nr:serine hydrolase domain-containing protein [Hyalangium gracile]
MTGRTIAAPTVLGLLLTACASAPPPSPTPPPPAAEAAAPAPAPVAAPPAPQVLEADAPRATPAGATFTAPGGWSLRMRESSVELSPPEQDTHVALVDVSATDANAAVAAAWKVHKPEMKRPLEVEMEEPGRNGWQERRVYIYETSPNERRVVRAFALRAGKAWTVVLLDASEPTIERRRAPFGQVLTSLRPAGYQRESFAGKTPHPLDAERVAKMREFVAKAARELDVPGVAISLIDGGKVVFEGGHGVRELGKPQPVDADTLFLAASNTKAMTTLLLARLVDAGKLRWEQPVVEVDPSFKLGDPDTTARVQVRHLVCACTGMPRQDMEWLFEWERATPASAMKLLGTMQPTSRFGEVFQYSNLMAAAAGYVAGHLAYPDREPGAAYDAAMTRELFEPLGMRGTTFDFKRAQSTNHASAHGLDLEGRTTVMPMSLNTSVIFVRPAGGVWTSARDLSRYVQLELARGKLPDGRQLVSEQNLLARYAPQVLAGADRTYGMGLAVDTTWGVKVVHHGGDLFGHHSDMLWLPEHGVGAVILTNSDAGVRMRRPFMRRLLEVLFDGQPEAEDDVRAAAQQLRALVKASRERVTVPPDAAAVKELAAHYRNDALGTLTVRTQGTRTVFDLGEWKSAMGSRRNEDGTLSFSTIEPGLEGLEFVVSSQGGKRQLITRDAQHEYVFEEAPPPRAGK